MKNRITSIYKAVDNYTDDLIRLVVTFEDDAVEKTLILAL